MISKQKIKTIHALRLKKQRDKSGLFIGEGPKVVSELLNVFPCTYLACTDIWYQANANTIPSATEYDIVSQDNLATASLQDTPQQVLGIFVQKKSCLPSPNLPATSLCLGLDTIQDPGNLGTILRIACWFGINHIICSPETTDIYSPKVVQSTMGALGKVNVYYTPLPQYLQSLPTNVPVYGTFLEGNDIHLAPLSNNGIIIMGNEGNGISAEVATHISDKLFIPPYPEGTPAIESLNVSVATAIVCAEFRRRH